MAEDDDIDGLAADYVLGSLVSTERRQVDARRPTEASLAAAVAAWERRLGPLSARWTGAASPTHALDGILSRIPATQIPTLPPKQEYQRNAHPTRPVGPGQGPQPPLT